MPSSSGRFHVFLCHNSADEAAVAELARKLNEAGLRPWLDKRDIAPGARWTAELENQVRSIAAVAVIVGPQGSGPWQDLELDVVLNRAARGECRLIPVILADCEPSLEPPPFLTAFQAVDFRRAGSDAFARLVAAIHEAQEGREVAARMPVHNIPRESLGEHFLGRAAILERLSRNLAGDPAAAAVAKQVLHGLGGIGKTCLAIEYAWRYGQRYSAIFFVSAESPQALLRNLAGLARPRLMNLDLDGVTAEDQVAERVLRWLHENPGWLLILDNVDSEDAAELVVKHLPQLDDGHVILTSRIARWAPVLRLHQIDRLGDDVGARYLLERTDSKRPHKGDDAQLATSLASHLDGLPLALELAAAYISVHRLSLADYLESWKNERSTVLAWYDRQETLYPASLAVTWQKSFVQLGLTARSLLRLMSHLGPEVIPAAMLVNPEVAGRAARLLAQEENETLAWKRGDALTPTELRSALAELSKHSLAIWEAEEAVMHRIVQAVVRSYIAGGSRTAWVEMAVQLVSDFTPGDPSDMRTWQDWDRMRPHARSVIELARRHHVWLPTTELMNNLGLLLYSRALFADAESMFREALKINERLSGFEARDQAIATNLHNLARVLHEVDRRDDVEILYRRAIELDEKIYGREHPEVAMDLYNLARLLHDSNRLGEAEDLYRRALEIDESTNPRKGAHIARDLSGLGRLLLDTNRIEKAEATYRRALRLDMKVFGSDHTFVARDHYNLACLLHATYRVDEADQQYRRALEIREENFGDRHPYVATTLHNLARLLHDTNRLEEARNLYRRALRIDEEVLGPEHHNVARDLNNLARFYRDLDQNDEAEPLYRRALSINKAALGENHPHVATVLNNLSRSLQDREQWEEAEACCRQALEIDEGALGRDHPHVARDLYTFSRLLHETRRTEEAVSRCQRALEIEESAFGAHHPHVATLLNFMARLFLATRQPEEAEELCRRALRINECVFAADHPRIARVRFRLASVLREQDREEDAIFYAKSAVEILRRSFGDGHASTRTVRCFLESAVERV